MITGSRVKLKMDVYNHLESKMIPKGAVLRVKSFLDAQTFNGAIMKPVDRIDEKIIIKVSDVELLEDESWYEYLFMLSYAVAMKSKDESSKFGAIIVNDNKSIISTGYNSFPRGLNDSVKERQQRPDKYLYFEHSERNAIYNAARTGAHTEGCTIYTQGMPCADCARAVVQAGIKRIILHQQWADEAKKLFDGWEKSQAASKVIFDECGVVVDYWSGFVPNLKCVIRGKEVNNIFHNEFALYE